MSKIFISYRRADTRKDAGRIYDRLAIEFGEKNVFIDSKISPGKDFRGELRKALAECTVQLAIIGNQWLDIKDIDGNYRLNNSDDFVRMEIESALQRGDDCLLIPVLVDDASMPIADKLPSDLRELAFKQAMVARDDPDFHADVDKIIRVLRQKFISKNSQILATNQSQTITYDVYKAISEYYSVSHVKDWDRAREILAEIRNSGNAPRIFDVDATEKHLWNIIESEERDKQYDLLRIMANQKDFNQKHFESTLHTFWEDFPDYDPDKLIGLTSNKNSDDSNEVKPNVKLMQTSVSDDVFTGNQYATKAKKVNKVSNNNIFDSFFGLSRPFNYVGKIIISLEEAYKGVNRKLTVDDKTYNLFLSRGINNTELNLKELGLMSHASYVKVVIKDHELFTREVADLNTTIEVNEEFAQQGGLLFVKTLGEPFNLQVKSGFKSGTKYRLPGMGMPIIDKIKEFGDLYVELVYRVMPHTLSVETLGGIATPIIDRGESLPHESEMTFSTAADNQEQVEIHLIYGEATKANDNLSLGKFILAKLQPKPKGLVQVKVTFNIDSEYRLLVTAGVPGNEQTFGPIDISKL